MDGNLKQSTAIQNKYKVLMLRCTELLDNKAGSAEPGFLWFASNKPFIMLPARVIDNTQKNTMGIPVDALSRLDGSGLNNGMMYIQGHPAIQLAEFCDLNAFHSLPGSHLIPDLRKKKGVMADGTPEEIQVIFIMEYINWL